MPELTQMRLHAVISGYVQGVGFRAFIAERAEFLGLTGWCRNTLDGDVEVTVEGPRPDLDIFLSSLRKGPRGSQVFDIDAQFNQAVDEFLEFKIRPTA
jgi:acylphosphatase